MERPQTIESLVTSTTKNSRYVVIAPYFPSDLPAKNAECWINIKMESGGRKLVTVTNYQSSSIYKGSWAFESWNSEWYQYVTNSDLAPKQVTLSLTFDTYQGSIRLIKSGKTVQIFCDICAKTPVPTLTKIADVPSDFLPQMSYLSCFTNRGTGQSVPVFIGNDGIFRTTELLGLEANVVYYGAGCYVCR